jgi:Ni/Co efflux regulator RcnB
MKHLVAALVMAAFSAASLAQGTTPATPAGNKAAATPAASAKTTDAGTKKAKKKKAKKSKAAPEATTQKPAK